MQRCAMARMRTALRSSSTAAGTAFAGDGGGDDRRRGRKGRARVVIGWEAKGLDVLARVTGSGYQRLVATAAARFLPWPGNRAPQTL